MQAVLRANEVIGEALSVRFWPLADTANGLTYVRYLRSKRTELGVP
jgi:hypothetical protein